MKHVELIKQIEEIWYNRHRTKRQRKNQRALRRLENRTFRVNVSK